MGVSDSVARIAAEHQRTAVASTSGAEQTVQLGSLGPATEHLPHRQENRAATSRPLGARTNVDWPVTTRCAGDSSGPYVSRMHSEADTSRPVDRRTRVRRLEPLQAGTPTHRARTGRRACRPEQSLDLGTDRPPAPPRRLTIVMCGFERRPPPPRWQGPEVWVGFRAESGPDPTRNPGPDQVVELTPIHCG